MKLNLLISTINNSINNISNNIKNIDNTINIFVCHQITTTLDYVSNLDKRVEVVQMFEKGLSRSRNCLINHSNSGICIISDDDVQFNEKLKRNIELAYTHYPDADIITFQALTPDGKFYKNYSKKPFRHTLLTAGKVSSIEITFKKESIVNKGISFDNQFGLGSTYTSGEEFIFISDAINKGLNVYYYPLPISIHPIDSSGKVFSKDMFVTKGALFYRVFKKTAYIYIILFAIKKYSMYKSSFDLFSVIKFMHMGLVNFKEIYK